MKSRKTTSQATETPQRNGPRRISKHQLSRHQREVRQQRIAIAAVAVAFAIVLLVPIYGYWREVLAKGDQPIALVRGNAISTDLYARYLGYQQARLQREIERVVAKTSADDAKATPAASATPADPKATPTAAQKATESYQLALQFLQQRAGSLSSQAVDDMIEGRLVRDEAAKRGLTASPTDIDAALQKEMSDYSFGGYGLSAITGQPAESLTLDQSREEMNKLLGRGKFLTPDEFQTYVLETSALRGKLEDALAVDLKPSGEQIHARHILVDTEEQAKDVRARLDKGEDFAAVAKELSKDTSNKDKGGDLDWFGRGAMLPEFEQAAFALKVGEISAPIQTSYGYHIIKLDERANDRPFSAEWIARQRSQLFSDWLAKQRSEVGAVQMFASNDKLAWASDYVSKQFAGGK